VNTIGNPVLSSCPGTSTHWVHKIDWSTGYPVWSGKYGSSSLSAASNGLVLHPTLELFCGLISFNGLFGSGCDLDLTAGVNQGEANASPGQPLNYWSLFPFCQNVSSDTGVLPPAWTHTISSTGDDGSQTFVASFRGGWAGNDMFIQALSRATGNVAKPQGLQWPYTGIHCSIDSRTLLFF